MLGDIVVWFLATMIFFAIGARTLDYTIVNRRRLLGFPRVEGSMRRIKGAVPVLTWTFRGTSWSSSPSNTWIISNSKVKLFINPENSTSYILDIWTENYRWGYLVSSGSFLMVGMLLWLVRIVS